MTGLQIDRVLDSAVRENASDIHLKVGSIPVFRRHGILERLNTEPLTGDVMGGLVRGILSDEEFVKFSSGKDIDRSLEMEDKKGVSHRYRVNVAKDDNGPYITIRVIPDNIMPVDEIGFPYDVHKEILDMKRGLVLVTGETGSGKTTTLASIVNEINRTRAERIITLEEPIEYIHADLKSVISQREIGKSVADYRNGVKSALRQDPDILLVGEIRDKEVALRSIEASATGHMVYATMHTKEAGEAVSRIVSLFEASEQDNIRDTMANSASYILSQQLIPYRGGKGRTLAMEVLNVCGCPAVRNHIRKGDYNLIQNEMQSGRKFSMLTMNQHLIMLEEEGKISKEDAIAHSYYKDELLAHYSPKGKQKFSR